jgi:hypothetical protein
MLKKISLSLSIFLLLAFFLNSFSQTDDSQTNETITITTYYPSPYGVYNKLQTNMLAVGDMDGDGELTSQDLPNISGNIRLKPQAGDPATWPSGRRGEFAYSSTQDALYHYNGSKWVKEEGGGGVKIVKDSGIGYASVDCGEGWIITRCGEGMSSYSQAQDFAVRGFYGDYGNYAYPPHYLYFYGPCSWSAHGASSYSYGIGSGEGNYYAIIAECVKSGD